FDDLSIFRNTLLDAHAIQSRSQRLNIRIERREKLQEQFRSILLKVSPRRIERPVSEFKLDRRVIQLAPFIIELHSKPLGLHVLVVFLDNVDRLVELAAGFLDSARFCIHPGEQHERWRKEWCARRERLL